MTTDIEKQFFETFGIEPEIESCYHSCTQWLNCKQCDEAITKYPEITDRILLGLLSICVLYGWHLCRYWNGNQDFVYENQKLKPKKRFCVIDTDLKNATLILLIELVNKEGIKQQVQTLFKEDRKC